MISLRADAKGVAQQIKHSCVVLKNNGTMRKEPCLKKAMHDAIENLHEAEQSLTTLLDVIDCYGQYGASIQNITTQLVKMRRSTSDARLVGMLDDATALLTHHTGAVGLEISTVEQDQAILTEDSDIPESSSKKPTLEEIQADMHAMVRELQHVLPTEHQDGELGRGIGRATRVLTGAHSHISTAASVTDLQCHVTTLPPTVLARMLVALDNRSAWFLHHSFRAAQKPLAVLGSKYVVDWGGRVEFALIYSSLFARGANARGQTGTGILDHALQHYIRVHLPSVRDFSVGHGAAFAITTGGLYVWGGNKSGSLGVGKVASVARRPRRVPLPAGATVLKVCPMAHSTFIETSVGWFAAGANQHGQLGIDDGAAPSPLVPQPELVKARGTITRVYSQAGTTFLWTVSGPLLACGINDSGQSGVGGLHPTRRPTPVRLPAHSHVTGLITSCGSTFIFCGTRCFVCGNNMYSKLGVRTDDQPVDTPTELPFPVSVVAFDFAAGASSTLFISNGVLIAAGENNNLVAAPIAKPTTIDELPANVVGLKLSSGYIVRQGHDRWHAARRRPEGVVIELGNFRMCTAHQSRFMND